MRIFIGIKFDDNTRREIDRALKPFKKISSPIKWVKTENIHLTLKFIGEVPAEKVTRVEESLTQRDFNVGAFDLEIAGFGKFGRDSELNILWVGIKKNEKLEDIYRRIEDSFYTIGIPKEQRPFKAHLTVGRNKKRYNFKPIFERLQENAGTFVCKFRVKAFQIFKSELFSTGPLYSVLKEIAVDNA
ncbi:RNA 2',3'-cyclic phosphodiesterase [Acidobacteriota bacterium]